MQTNRDKPLNFRWRSEENWLSSLPLPAASNVNFEITRTAILLDAVIEAAGYGRRISYSRRKAFYANRRRYYGPAHTHLTVVLAVDQLASIGLLEHVKSRPNLDFGRQSTLRASPTLMASVMIPFVEFHRHETIELKDSQKRLIEYVDSERTFRMRRELARFNEAIASCRITLDGVEHEGQIIRFPCGTVANTARISLHRVFNIGWSKGGRFYGLWVQNIPKEYRETILIDGVQTAEPDYPQLHPVLLYALVGSAPVGDAYTLPGWPRPIAKRAFNTIINAVTYRSALGAVAADVRETSHTDDDMKTAAKLIADLKERHRPIARFFHSGIGRYVQFIDSQMAANVMRSLLGKNVVALPIHDSFRVQECHQQTTLEAMDGALWRAKKQARNGNFRVSGFL